MSTFVRFNTEMRAVIGQDAVHLPSAVEEMQTVGTSHINASGLVSETVEQLDVGGITDISLAFFRNHGDEEITFFDDVSKTNTLFSVPPNSTSILKPPSNTLWRSTPVAGNGSEMTYHLFSE